MKNLVVNEFVRLKFPCWESLEEDNNLPLDMFKKNISDTDLLIYPWKCAVNANNGDLYVPLDVHLVSLSIYGENTFLPWNFINWKKIVGLEYCITTQLLYCALDHGDIVTLNPGINGTDDSSGLTHEIVASFDGGLQCMKLSPDHEIITVVTDSGTVITMVSDFQVISEVNLYSSDFGERQFITVGWGKKNTQFHGSEGKAAAKAKPEQIIARESDDDLPRITWREDGTLFAVSFLHTATKIRQFKVFNREGILQYTSEPTNGLEECLAWKPSGSLIAAPQRLANKLVVALFEKNGLKHREFSLPFEAKDVKVLDLFWSPDSDILAIICEQSDTRILQLWTENNCHWYLKQTRNFSADNPLMYATWSPVGRCDKKELILVTLREIIICSFKWCVNHSRGKTVDDKAVVGVIDGKKILITAFREKIIPPPMAQQSLEFDEPINAVFFAPDVEKKCWINSNVFCTVSCNNKFTFFRQKVDSPTTYEVVQTDRFQCERKFNMFEEIMDCSTLHHFLWLTRNIILYSKTTDVHNLLCILPLDDAAFSCKNTYIMDAPIQHIVPSPDADAAYVITDKAVLKYTIDTGLVPTSIELKELCNHVEVVKLGLKHLVIALSCSNRLLIDGKEVTNNITSFHVHSEFLLLTTLQHTLICIPLNESGMKQLRKHDLTIKPWEHSDRTSFADIGIGRVERGSHIITAVPRGSKTILQMPRGNLECIEPRPLLLRIVGFRLDNCDYRTAIDLVRKHHINPNLIHDHNPHLFMSSAEKFVEGNATSNWLCRFLSELQDVDVTTTMYASCYEGGGSVQSNATVSKVDNVCRTLRDIMEKRHDADDLIQPILLSLMKNAFDEERGTGLQLALRKFNEVRVSGNSVIVENAFVCLKLATNTRTLYDTALGVYDCELALFIASKSQMDPKEYVPFLKNLKQLEENYMKYSIDMHLRRYESALVHLSKVPGKFEECMNLTRDHNLHETAITLFEQGSTEHKRVAGVFGDYLLSKKMYSEAAAMFYESEDFQKALDAHMSAGNWKDCIAVATRLDLSSVDLHELYREIVKRLKADGRYAEAAEVLKYYLNDAEEAVASLCEGRCWERAIRIAQEVQRLDLNETHIVPGIKEHEEHAVTQLHGFAEHFLKYKSRLSTVRAEINAKQTSEFNDIVRHNTPTSNREVMDFLSDASSVAGSAASQRSRISTASGRSYRSSKNRRKQERKLFSLKEGSTFEDLGLIHALYDIFSNACKFRDEWSELEKALVHFKFDERAEELKDKIDRFFELVERSKAEIWDESAPTSHEKVTTDASTLLAEVTMKIIDMLTRHPPSETNMS